MISDKILMIPVLSKELNLIGQPSLPFQLEKPKRSKTGNEVFEGSLKIMFDSKIMIESLLSICFDLVKQIKLFGEKDEDALYKISFANSKLEKELKVYKLEISKMAKALALEKELNQQLQEKVSCLQQQIKNLQIHEKKIVQKNKSVEDLLKHSIRKKDSELIELHKTLWKHFNIVDKNFLPANLVIMESEQPDFNKLWSEVKYSNLKTKEDLLKQAIGMFQKNNKILTEDNIVLKTFLITYLQEIQEVQKLMRQKMQIPDEVLFNYKIQDICPDRESFNFFLCKNILFEHLNLLKKIGLQFEKASFFVGDDLFVCWSDIICTLLDI